MFSIYHSSQDLIVNSISCQFFCDLAFYIVNSLLWLISAFESSKYLNLNYYTGVESHVGVWIVQASGHFVVLFCFALGFSKREIFQGAQTLLSREIRVKWRKTLYSWDGNGAGEWGWGRVCGGDKETETETKRSEISKSKMPGRSWGGHEGGHLPFYSHLPHFSPSLDNVANSPAHALSPGLCDLFPILGSLHGLFWSYHPWRRNLWGRKEEAVLSGVRRVKAVQSAYHCLTWKPHSSIQVISSLRLLLSLLTASTSTSLLYCLLPLLGDGLGFGVFKVENHLLNTYYK